MFILRHLRLHSPSIYHQFVRYKSGMALSRFEYVKKFEADDSLLRDTWIVVRIDGKGKRVTKYKPSIFLNFLKSL